MTGAQTWQNGNKGLKLGNYSPFAHVLCDANMMYIPVSRMWNPAFSHLLILLRGLQRRLALGNLNGCRSEFIICPYYLLLHYFNNFLFVVPAFSPFTLIFLGGSNLLRLSLWLGWAFAPFAFCFWKQGENIMIICAIRLLTDQGSEKKCI